MPAGFLVTRLLLVCLLNDVDYNLIFAAAQSVVQPQAWQVVGSPYDYFPNLPLQPVQQMRQPYDHNNPWMKLVEDLTKNRLYPEVIHQPSLHQQIQNPYKRAPQIRIKYPDGVPAQTPAMEAKKVEFNVNLPLHQLIKGLVLTKRGSDMIRDVRESDWVSPVLYQDGVSGPSWPEHKGLSWDILKRRRTPGVNIKFSTPMQVHRDRRPSLQRPEMLAYLLGQSELAQKSSPEFGLQSPNMHYGLPHHSYFDPAHNLQMTKSDWHSANWGPVNSGRLQPALQPAMQPTLQPAVQPALQPAVQPTLQPAVQPTLQPEQQIQQAPQLPSLRQIFSTGNKDPSAFTRWAEEITKQLPHIKLSIEKPDSGSGDPSKQAPQQNSPENDNVARPQVRCSPPTAQKNYPKLWTLCPWLVKPCLT